MASRQNNNYTSQVLNSQATTNSNSTATTNVKDRSSHNKSDTKLKHGKVIHKFTSESYLRLICEKTSSSSSSNTSSNDEKKFIDKSSSTTGHVVPLSSNTIINNMSKKKGTSFQITSVSVSSANSHHHHQQTQRNSTDNNGDDSADDLDDSHTDDNISRITDYETPSISETFSGEDVFFAQQNAFGTAPVIPTSSQYGLAIVGPPDGLGGNGANLTDVHVSVTDAGTINFMGPISSKQDPDHKNERFKVVKIESTEPFKRGRWMCMDYLDHTTLQAQDDGIDGKEGDENSTTKDDSLTENTEILGTKLSINNGDIEHVFSDNEELDHEVNKINSSSNINSLKQHHDGTSHPQTMTSIPTYIDHSNIQHQHQQHNQVAQSLPQGQIEKIITQEKLSSAQLDHSESNRFTIGNQQIGVADNSTSHSVSAQHNQQQQQHHAQTMTQEMIHNMVHPDQHQQQHQFHHHQGVTLPTNILLQNIGHDPQNFQQSQQHLSSPNSSNANVLPLSNQTLNNTPIPITQKENSSSNIVGGIEGGEYNNQDTMTSQFVGTGDRMQNESDNNHQPQQHHQIQMGGNVVVVTNENINNTNNNNNNSDNNNNITISNDGTQNVSSPSSSAGLGTVAEGAIGGSNDNESASVNSSATGGADDGQQQAINEDNER